MAAAHEQATLGERLIEETLDAAPPPRRNLRLIVNNDD